MRYRKIKFVHNKAGVKPTALQNCTTPWQTKPHQKLMEHKMCPAIYFDQTTPWQVVYFFSNSVIKWLLYD